MAFSGLIDETDGEGGHVQRGSRTRTGRLETGTRSRRPS
jgi:hypothetical protein